ncbi:MAG: S-layer homology domain-containing protein [Firmicutes bacterium]|nr:S-layer homology domain-containing protein [Bacillota bacterium]
MKKIIPAALALSMAITTVPAFAAVEIPGDIAGTGYEAAVSRLLEEGIVSGYKDGTFRPENSVTRAEVCAMIIKAGGQSAVADGAADTFSDLSGSAWAADFINAASDAGIVSGYKDGTFRPKNNITYNELSSMLVKAAGVSSKDITGGWPAGYIDKATELGAFENTVTYETAADGAKLATRGDVAIAIFNMKDEIAQAAEAGYVKEVPVENGVTENKDKIGYEVANATEEFTGEAMKLSLEDAVKKMQTESVSAETARLNKQGDQNKADGYGDSYSSMKEAMKYMDYLDLSTQYQMQESGMTEVNQDIVKLQRDFARANIETNYQAELNKIRLDTIQTYYGLLQAQDALRIQEENLQVQKDILALTEKKYEQGVVSKIDLLSAQNSVVKAESDVTSAKNLVAQAKMGVNMLLEQPLMQELTLTTSYEQLALPEISLTDAINSAMKQRNELTSVEFSKQVMELNFNSIRYRYGVRSTKYKDAEVQMMQVEQACELMPANIEMDIRNRYADIHAKYQAVEAAEDTLAYAKEGYRIANVTYNAGMSTISDVQQAQVGVLSANLGLSSAIAAYNQAVYEFEIAIGIGTERISF